MITGWFAKERNVARAQNKEQKVLFLAVFKALFGRIRALVLSVVGFEANGKRNPGLLRHINL
jgi:hypothetical protein